jgi:hypothetical protein
MQDMDELEMVVTEGDDCSGGTCAAIYTPLVRNGLAVVQGEEVDRARLRNVGPGERGVALREETILKFADAIRARRARTG